MPANPSPPVFRFAPSPNGRLHLGHALSALCNEKLARERGGRLLLRIEDIDTERCTPAFERGMIDDLGWLGIAFERPYRRQSEHFAEYRSALDQLIARDLVYPAFLSRAEARRIVTAAEADGAAWPRDPDWAAHHPALDRSRTAEERLAMINSGRPFAWRLDMEKALAEVSLSLTFTETGSGPEGESGTVAADPARWGDVVLARRDTPTSYHLSVVLDDALQGITHVVRGRDLFHATSVHVLLQALLGLQSPLYHHHALVLAPDGAKLSKSRSDTALAELRAGGATPGDIRRRLGFA